jgi:phosphate starvation-inducible PhoH-like protein
VHVVDVLKSIEGISFTHFTSKDVVRHPLVQRIVEAYARHDETTDTSAAGGRPAARRAPAADHDGEAGGAP